MQTAEFDPKEAVDCYLHPHVCFADLKPGEVFRFPGFENRLVKGKRGYRREGQSHVFCTGRKTAVINLQ
jgi:hypothetical protein